MQNSNFTENELSNFNLYSCDTAFFDDSYDHEIEENIELNKKAAKTDFEILKFSKSRKIALFKDKNKVYYTSLQGCNCKQYENSDFGSCVHMFKLAQLLGIIEPETGVLLYPQKEFIDIPFDNELPAEQRKYVTPSTKGIGKRCKYCNSVIAYDDEICPKCGRNSNGPAAENVSDSNISYIKMFLIVLVVVILFVAISNFLR